MITLIFIAIIVLGFLRLSSKSLNDYLQRMLLGTNADPDTDTFKLSSGAHAHPSHSTFYFLSYFLLGIFLLLIGFWLIQLNDPNYFVQDDCLVTELPGLIYFCRSVFAGQLPEFNPYNLLGSPGWSSGGGGTYPFLYPAYLLSVLIFGNEFNTLDVLACMHMLAGYVVMFLLASRIGLSPPLALLSALSFLFSGSLLITGRCWHAFHALSFYLPAIFLGVHEFGYGKFSWCWILIEGILIGLLYHAGFPQAWMLTMLLAGIAAFILIPSRRVSYSHSLKLIPMLMIGASIVYPLYYQQSLLAKDLVMESGYGGGLEYQILAILLPYPLVESLIPNGWGSTFFEYGGHFSYFGTILAIGAFCANLLVLSTWYGKTQSTIYASYVWSICCFISFLLTMGEAGYLWYAIKALPAGMSNHPFRCYSMFVFFATLSGGLFFQRLFQNQRQCVLILNIICLLGLSLIFYHLNFVRAAFYNYAFSPYPPLAEIVNQKVKQDPTGIHRLITYAPDRSIDPFFPYALPLSLPLIYEIPSIHGYDPLTENKAPYRQALKQLETQPVSALYEYGIKWALVHKRGLQLQSMLQEGKLTKQTPYLSPMAKFTILFLNSVPYELVPTRYIPSFQALIDYYNKEKINLVEFNLSETEGNVSLLELKSARPLAFFPDSPTESIQLTLRADGLDLSLPKATTASTRQLVINFLLYPPHTLTAGDKQFPLSADEWGRITAQIPPEITSLQLRYATTWLKGILIGAFLFFLAIATLYYLEKANPEPMKIP